MNTKLIVWIGTCFVAMFVGSSVGTATGPWRVAEQLRGMGVEIVDSIPKLLEKVDVVLLESVDGRIHLQEAKP